MMRRHANIAKVCLAAALAVLVSSCGRVPGLDTDGDGLFDLQELLFGTNIDDDDTDNDGIPDGRDDDPLSGDPRIRLTASPAFQDETGQRCVVVGVRVVDGRGNGVGDADVSVSWDLGELTDVVTDVTGSTQLKACSASQDDTTLQAESHDLGGRFDVVRAELDLSLKHLVVPGVNTSPDVDAGPVAGSLKVVALYRNGSGFLKPFEGASVFVQPATGEVPFQTTGPAGVVQFVDDDLKGLVDVTIGAPGHRYVTYFGLQGASVSVVLDQLDVVTSDAASGFGTITGKAVGFLGEGGLEPLPSAASLLSGGRIAVAIVQIAINGRPLSSMSMGSVLEEPDEIGVPGNMPMCFYSDPAKASCENSVFRLTNVPEGQHLLFALGGTVGDAFATIEDPYQIDFKPLALGIVRVDVKAGQVTTQDILMNIDLATEGGETVEMYLGHLPVDYKTGIAMPNALAMPVIDTGGEGFIFVSINGDYNRDGFQNPVSIRFPEADNPILTELGIKTTNLAVGLAGRASYNAGDPPGISTPVRPGVMPGDKVRLDTPSAWLEVPELTVPAVTPPGVPLDAVSADVFDGVVRWNPVDVPVLPDLFVVRLNYLTAAVENIWVTADDGKHGTLGGPRSHALWEMFVPAGRTEIRLPVFPEGFPTPYLGNPDPTPADSPSPHRFDADTIEVELSAYVLGADGKDFEYSQEFAYSDVNMHCAVVSQDSVPVKLKK